MLEVEIIDIKFRHRMSIGRHAYKSTREVLLEHLVPQKLEEVEVTEVVSTDLFLEASRGELQSVHCEDSSIQYQKVNARLSHHCLSELLHALQILQVELEDDDEIVCVTDHITAHSRLGDFICDRLTTFLHIARAHDDPASSIGESLACLESDARIAASHDRDLAGEEVSLPLGVVVHHLLRSRLLPELRRAVAHFCDASTS